MSSLLKKNNFGCSYLLLAPMEGLGDRTFRKAMAFIGGFDEACTEFLRVPTNAHVPSLAKKYQPHATHPIPEAVQLMGSNPELMADMARAVVQRGAPRVDLNCGCPSNTVTGRGAGSSLLKEPGHLYKVAKAMVDAVSVPVTAKLRIGYEDTSLFKENILAAQESGIQFLTLHPRTKADGYGPPARWEFIAEAKQLLRIPVVGNGDILTLHDALKMLKTTGCDALMIGRGSVINPFIFLEIKAHFAGQPFVSSADRLKQFLAVFLKELPSEMPLRTKINKLKQVAGFLFRANHWLQERRQAMLTGSYPDPESFLQAIVPILKEGWNHPSR
jgi:tRNA-dihydrouridine synthase C